MIDLSKAAAGKLGMVEDGIVRVRIEVTRQQR
jgi:rare lipoprotein A (peptidoglycan hydrolase)